MRKIIAFCRCIKYNQPVSILHCIFKKRTVAGGRKIEYSNEDPRHGFNRSIRGYYDHHDGYPGTGIYPSGIHERNDHPHPCYHRSNPHGTQKRRIPGICIWPYQYVEEYDPYAKRHIFCIFPVYFSGRF